MTSIKRLLHKDRRTSRIRRRSTNALLRRIAISVGALESDACTAVTLHSGEFVAQSEMSAPMTLVWRKA